MVTNTPRPGNNATAFYLQSPRTLLTGTPTPTPHNLATATFTPRPTRTMGVTGWKACPTSGEPTRTPVCVWWDGLPGARVATPMPTPTTPPIPPVLRGKILFLSDRGEQPAAYMLDTEMDSRSRFRGNDGFGVGGVVACPGGPWPDRQDRQARQARDRPYNDWDPVWVK